MKMNVMKSISRKIVLFILISSLVSAFVACSDGTISQNNDKLKNTPTRVGKNGTMSGSIAYSDYGRLSTEADLIAEIEISEWLREVDEPSEKTFFKAKVLKVFNTKDNSNVNEITLEQPGNSRITIKEFPLFVNGDRLVLFMKKDLNVSDLNTYWILGGEMGVFKVKTLENSEYVAKFMGDWPELNEVDMKDSAQKSKIEDSIKKELADYPNNSKNMNIIQAFKKETFEKKLDQLLKDKKGKE